MQSRVDKKHRGLQVTHDALSDTVYDCWNCWNYEETVTKVFHRLHKVLLLIQQDKGGNNLVETKRGKRYVDLDLWKMESAPSKVKKE